MSESATLEIQAPAGAHFEFEEVKTAKGLESLGNVPILVWDSLESATAYYGEQGIINVLDGTSLRVSFQNIARRHRAAKKSDDDIAKAQVEFKPGKRAGGVSTPESRAARLAKKAVEKSGNSEAIEKLLERIAAGEVNLSLEDVASL